MADLWIANTISDLIQGDVNEHLPLERIPLQGDVLGLGTTTSIDNGELTFLQDADGVVTTIWKCQASDGGIRALRPGDGSSHFPYVCFSGDATAVRTPVDLASLSEVRGRPLQELVAEAIAQLRQQGRLAEAPIYGLRLVSQWESLVITVASKLCMGQQRRNTSVASSAASDGTAARSIYQLLQHYRLAPENPGDPSDPIRFLGRSLEWDCCGFFDTDPAQGRVTIPDPHAHLHLHGCSTDLRYGGHLHHEHPGTRLASLQRLVLYPLQQLHQLVSDLAIEALYFRDGSAHFTVANRGAMDVSDVGVAVVVNDSYGGHRYLRLPWLAAGASETFSVPLQLPAGCHRLEVIADPEGQILEEAAFQFNNRATLDIQLPDV
ncbi:hypothetical protein KBY75_02460 [Cyanobium sp. T1G-Tous]|uniref:CARDB domain-containing protein n=1 Tax=unclassified Cyanobium TaxID=2627006 RepID=UPI0020CD2FE0|nr:MULTISPECIES: CARDB domain-containing protein [unclassified Cyanobium]MCP9777197.1 hypothetical protein [Cyanobium sp. Tous-M-B4]MCP9802426.1 hypothetical protein [Cyanobium sp. T1G-Tous]MCP9877960.1 hypothetical protein [Cyanobium sp. A2C-AMD]